jgi:serine phosphatase RsbU (regulator of sigma subunit)
MEYDTDLHAQITFCGAKRPLIYYQQGNQTMNSIKGDLKPIGGKYYKDLQFTEKKLILNKGCMIYLTTDGLIDQNSPQRKKLGTLTLLQILITNKDKKMEEQKFMIEKALDDHQQNESQRDDITMIGIKT